jgi:hypothetical protein
MKESSYKYDISCHTFVTLRKENHVIRPSRATDNVIHISCDILQLPETERVWQRFTRQGALVQSRYRPPYKSNAQATPEWPFLLETPSDQITGENDFAASNVAKVF